MFSLNELLSGAMASQGFPKRADIEGKAVLLHERIRPDTFKKRFFLDYMAGILNQNEEGFKDFGPQGHALPLAQKDPLRRVKEKRPKLINVIAGCHGYHSAFSQKNLRFL
jgi:hypothetical protein